MSKNIAIITGGSRGLGKSMALHLAERGVDSILTYHSAKEEAGQVVATIEAKGGKATALPLDVADTSSFEGFAAAVRDTLGAKWRRTNFDFLINNAGVGAHTAFLETTEETFDQLVNVHLKGTFFLTQRLVPQMADGGRIINVSSGLTRFSLPGYISYAMMKGGIEVFTRYLAKELAGRQISVNTFAPGAIETDFGGGAVRDNAEVNAFIASVTALGRAGQPDDIGGAVASLLAKENHWITGQRIEASGGMFL